MNWFERVENHSFLFYIQYFTLTKWKPIFIIEIWKNKTNWNPEANFVMSERTEEFGFWWCHEDLMINKWIACELAKANKLTYEHIWDSDLAANSVTDAVRVQCKWKFIDFNYRL